MAASRPAAGNTGRGNGVGEFVRVVYGLHAAWADCPTCDSGNMWFVRHMFLEEMDMGKGYAGR